MSKLTGAVVEWYEYSKNHEKINELVLVGTGTFLEYGICSEEVQYGTLTYSSVIILKKDGFQENIPVEHVKFVNGINNHTPEGKEKEYMASMINDGS